MLIDLPIPYQLKAGDLRTEPHSSYNLGLTLDNISKRYTNGQLGPDKDEVVERMFRAAILLFHNEAGSFAECLDTALIWEVG